MIEKRSKLGESQTLQQFSRDVDEIEAWISEKLQTATDESYKDPTNIQVCISPGQRFLALVSKAERKVSASLSIGVNIHFIHICRDVKSFSKVKPGVA